MIFLSVLYDESDPSTYEGIELHFTPPEFEPEQREVFNTGNPTHDYLTAISALQEMYGEKAEGLTRHLSSYDHFAMDGGDLPEDGFSEEQIQKARRAALVFLTSQFSEPGGRKGVSGETSDQIHLNLIKLLTDQLSPEGLRRLSRGVRKLIVEGESDLVVLTPEEQYVVWAVLLSSVHDIHAAQYNLTEKQCDLEEALYDKLLIKVEKRDPERAG